MNERRLNARRSDHLQKGIDCGRVRVCRAEGDVEILDARRFRRGGMDLDVRARLGRQAEVDDGGVAHLLDGGYRVSGNGAAQATVDSTLAKFRMPGTSCFTTWALLSFATRHPITVNMTSVGKLCMPHLLCKGAA